MQKCSIFAGAAALFVLAGGASAQWSDNFDSYSDGQLLDGVGGWAGWDGIGIDAPYASSAQSRSAPLSGAVGNGYSDGVHPYSGYTSGAWVYTAYQYIPSGLDGLTYFILNNEYNHGGPYDWAVEMHMDPATGMVTEEIQNLYGNGTAEVPIVYDQWVEIRVDFDLDNNTMETFYNGQLVSAGTWNIRQGGLLELQSVDLYAPHSATVYFDDMSLEAAGGDCYADFNEDGTVDTRDVLAFLNSWNGGDLASDCDGNGTIDTRDVLCFLNLWNAGC
jgi:hypothetical protein